MAKKVMTMHELLVNIKTTKKRLESLEMGNGAGKNLTMVAAMKASGDPSDIISTITSNYQTRISLIRNLEAYEKARATINATTKVKVGNVEMTISDAIKEKENIRWKKNLLSRMQLEITQVQAAIATENEKIMTRIERSYPISAESTPDTMDAMKKAREAEYEKCMITLIDPNKIATEAIPKLDAEISEFEAAVDAALSYINAITTVEVELAD